MTHKFIPYAQPFIDDGDRAAILDVLNTVWLTQGPKVAELEAEVARVCGTQHAVAVANGTAALHLAYAAQGIGPGDEIITSPVTFAATANAAVLLGAKVKFCDVDPETFTLDPNKIEQLITRNTKAIVPVDFTGHPCHMNEITEIADHHNIPVIVDAAHSFGASYHNKATGSLGLMSTFSFHAVKSVAAGEGGAITTDDAELTEKLRRLRSHGVVNTEGDMMLADIAADRLPGKGADTQHQEGKAGWYYEVQEPAWNYRMSDIQCALAISQIGKLEVNLEKRSDIAALYDAAFLNNPLIKTPRRPGNWKSAWHLYMIRLNLAEMKSTRREVFEALRSEGIGVHVHYIPVHLQPYYRNSHGTRLGDYPAAEAFYREALTLPMHPAMVDKDIKRVIEAIGNIIS
jgi:perosamine synthetase